MYAGNELVERTVKHHFARPVAATEGPDSFRRRIADSLFADRTLSHFDSTKDKLFGGNNESLND